MSDLRNRQTKADEDNDASLASTEQIIVREKSNQLTVVSCGVGLLVAFGVGMLIGFAVWGGEAVDSKPNHSASQDLEEIACDYQLYNFKYGEPDAPRITGSGFCDASSHNVQGSPATLLDDSLWYIQIIGDSGRDGFCCQRDVAHEMDRAADELGELDFVILAGDIFYPYGIDPTNEESKRQAYTSWKNVYIEPYSSLQVPWYLNFGDHDWMADPQGILELNDKQDEGFEYFNMEALYYHKTWNDLDTGTQLDIFFLDTTIMNPQYADNQEFHESLWEDPEYEQKQLDWLSSELSSTPDDAWKIVVGHHPIYTSGHHYEEDQSNMKNNLRDMLEDNGVSMYVCGHEHALEYLHDFDGKVSYFVTGAGSKMETVRWPQDYGMSIHLDSGFMSLSIGVSTAQVQFISYQGNWLSTHYIEKGGTPLGRRNLKN